MASVAQSAWRHFFSQLTSSRIGLGLLVSAPAIFSWIAGLVMEVSVDRRLRPVQAQIERIETDTDYLQDFVHRFEATELNRGALFLTLNALNATQEQKLSADRLFRGNSEAIGSLRRAAAVVFPDRWQTVMEPYEKLLNEGYDSGAQVGTMQEIDNTVMLAAKKHLTSAEAQRQKLEAQAASLRNTRYWMALILQPLGLICTLIAFVYNLKPRETRPPQPAA